MLQLVKRAKTLDSSRVGGLKASENIMQQASDTVIFLDGYANTHNTNLCKMILVAVFSFRKNTFF